MWLDDRIPSQMQLDDYVLERSCTTAFWNSCATAFRNAVGRLHSRMCLYAVFWNAVA